MVLGLFKSKAEMMKDKIIFTQKSRISSLEHELDELKRALDQRDDEIRSHRSDFDRSKERLVDQIVGLSDKFADLNQRMLDIANENARLKVLTRDNKTSLAMTPKLEAPKAASSKASKSKKKAKRSKRK